VIRLVFLALLLTALQCSAQSLSSDAFAYGIVLTPQTAAPAYELELPAAVYEGATRSDLGDLRIFNAAGEIAPHALHRPAAGPPEPTQKSAPFFPLPASEEGLDKLSVRLQEDAARTVIELSTDATTAEAAGINAYLVDVRAIEQPINGLALIWETPADGFLYKLEVAAGADLRTWRTLLSGATIAELAFGGHRLIQRQVGFAPVRTDFLRLTLADNGDEFMLRTVLVKLTGKTAAPELRWTAVDVQQQAAGEYRFTAPGWLPVRRLRIGLPQDNILAEATLFSRSKPQAPWRRRVQGLLYRLNVGETVLQSNELLVAPARDRHWQLLIDQGNGDLGTDPPAVELGWQPQRLTFIARGAGPYTLAYGSAQATPGTSRARTLLDRLGAETTDGLVSRAITVGKPRTLAGEGALTAPIPPLDWKRWLLWATLIIGVLGLSLMARRLLREVNAGER